MSKQSFLFFAEGRAEFTSVLSASADVKVDRAGFTIMHPVNGVAGRPVRVRHRDGEYEETTFPKRVGPAQPVFDIVGFSHQVKSTDVEFEFDGEVFELEDQRNWSDESFKTYCRPLSLPVPYKISKSEVVRQSVRLRFSEDEDADLKIDRHPGSTILRESLAPEILAAAEDGWHGGDHASASGFILRIGHGHDCSHEFLWTLAKSARRINACIDAELILDGGADVAPQVERIASALKANGISAGHVIAPPDENLKSFQQTGPRPGGATPDDCAVAARRILHDAKIGDYVALGNAVGPTEGSVTMGGFACLFAGVAACQ